MPFSWLPNPRNHRRHRPARVRTNSSKNTSKTFPKPNNQISKTMNLIFICILKLYNNKKRYFRRYMHNVLVDCVLYYK